MLERDSCQDKLIDFLLQRDSYPHDCESIRHIETHISHLFLTGRFAYKMKKPLNLGFLDFSSLEKRRYYCERELALNSRYAPELYCRVLPITEDEGVFRLGGTGRPAEYLVQMRQFDEQHLFLRMLERGALQREHILSLTDTIVRFHLDAAKTPRAWSIEIIRRFMQDNMAVLSAARPLFEHPLLQRVHHGQCALLARHEKLIHARQILAVKQLHGDLHLGNMCMYLGRPTLFDGLEFNDEYSCCDVWADFAFLFMDLVFRGRPDFAFAALNRYLERGDDFAGLVLLPLYASYRASVRAKVAVIAALEGLDAGQKTTEAGRYLDLAARLLQPGDARVIAIGGLSGSGKSTLAQALADDCGAVVIRSDAVRKHLFALSPEERATSNAYTPAASAAAYEGLRERCTQALDAGFPVIVDAVFSSPEERTQIANVAQQRNVQFDGLWCEVSAACARARIRARTNDISDADERVLDLQERQTLGSISWFRISTEAELPRIVAQVEKELRMKPRGKA